MLTSAVLTSAAHSSTALGLTGSLDGQTASTGVELVSNRWSSPYASVGSLRNRYRDRPPSLLIVRTSELLTPSRDQDRGIQLALGL